MPRHCIHIIENKPKQKWHLMIWLKGLWINTHRCLWTGIFLSIFWLKHIQARRVIEGSLHLAPPITPGFPEECDRTPGHLGLWLLSLGLLNKNYTRIQCSFVSLSASLAFSLFRFCNPEILIFSGSPAHVFTAPAGSGMGTLRCQKRGEPRFQNYFSSWYKCPQMQGLILRHLPCHEILWTSSILLLHRKIILSPDPSFLQLRTFWKNILTNSPAHTWFPLPCLLECLSLLPAQLWIISGCPGPLYRQCSFCCFLDDLLCPILTLPKCTHILLLKTKRNDKAKHGKA